MKIRQAEILLLTVAGVCFFAASALAQPTGEGVVVLRVGNNAVAERAGLKPGDLLLTWEHDGKTEKIRSPFDMPVLETERAALAPVAIDGLRGSEKMHWVLGDGAWNLKVRPNLNGELLAGYQQAMEAASAEKLADAVQRLRELARGQNSQSPAWLRPWLLLSTAQVQGDAGDWDAADQSCGQALHEAGSSSADFVSLLRMCGDVFYLREEKQVRASRYLRQAIEESRKSSPRNLTVAALLSSMGRIANSLDDQKNAEDLTAQAIEIQQELAPGTLTLAFNYNRIGVFYMDSGKLDLAVENLDRALAMREKLAPGTTALAQTLENLGNALNVRGDLDRCEAVHVRALALYEKLTPEGLLVAASLNDLAFVAQDRGDLRKAEEYRLRALKIQRRLAPEGGGVAASLNNLGLIAQQRGMLAEAEDYFTQSAEVTKKWGTDTLAYASTLSNLGAVARARGDLARADDVLHQSQLIYEKSSPQGVPTGVLYEDICELREEQGRLPEAEDYCLKALAIAQAAAPDSLEAANTLADLGQIESKRKNWERAAEHLQQALKIYAASAPGSIGHGQTLLAMGDVRKQQQKPEEAAALFQEGLVLLENRSLHLGGGEAAQAGFRSRFANYYASYVDLLISQGKTEVAFAMVERTRARAFLEMLSAARIDVRKGADPALVAQERSLQVKIAAKSNARLKLLSGNHSDTQIAVMDKEVAALLNDYREIEQQLRERSPAYAAFTQPQPLTTADVQHDLLDPGTVLLEYSLGEERSHVFVLKANALKVYTLAPRDQIETLAREAYNSLIARNQNGEDNPDRQRARLRKTDDEFAAKAAQLSQLVLAPLAAELRGQRLVIVSDGALQYIPFAALPEPRVQNPRAPGAPMMAAHVIVNLPSAAALKILRQAESGRPRPAKTVAVLADPVFSAEDGRLAGKSKPALVAASAPSAQARDDAPARDDRLTRSIRDVGLMHLSRLPYTRREADGILALAAPQSRMGALDFQATRARALDPDLGGYQLVHFATHGLIDNQHPELSGLVFSLFDDQGKPIEGFLPLEDIYNLNLPVNTVVLSACETGLGKEISSEGLVGMTRGFMYAGATRVVASLWKVNDVATAELMRGFYRGMLRDHLPASAALRQAQLQMSKEPRWSSPYFWAAFQLHGEWK